MILYLKYKYKCFLQTIILFIMKVVLSKCAHCAVNRYMVAVYIVSLHFCLRTYDQESECLSGLTSDCSVDGVCVLWW